MPCHARRSGIVAALFCGFWMRYWTVQNLDTEAATLAAESLKMLAALSDMAIFLMVGENTILFASMKNWGFIILTIVSPEAEAGPSPPHVAPNNEPNSSDGFSSIHARYVHA